VWRSCPWSLRRGFCRFSVGIGRVWSFRRRLLPAARRTGAGTRRSSAAARPSYPWVVDVPAGPWFSASPSRPAVRHSVHVKPRRITRARGIDPGGWGVLRLRIRILRILKVLKIHEFFFTNFKTASFKIHKIQIITYCRQVPTNSLSQT